MKNAAISIILVALAGGIFFFMKGCSREPAPIVNAALDSAHAQWLLDSGRMARRIVDLSFQKDSLQIRLDTTLPRLDSFRRALAMGIPKVEKTLAIGQDARNRGDLPALALSWDSLRPMILAGLPLVTGADSLSQQVIADCIAQGRVKDSLANSWRYLYLRTDTLYNAERVDNTLLRADNAKKGKQLGIWKVVGKAGVAYFLLRTALDIIF